MQEKSRIYVYGSLHPKDKEPVFVDASFSTKEAFKGFVDQLRKDFGLPEAHNLSVTIE